MDYNQHVFSKAEVFVVQQEAGWFQRGVAEAIDITKLDPNLNQERGRHHLPAIYREVLPTSCDLTSTSRSHDFEHVQ